MKKNFYLLTLAKELLTFYQYSGSTRTKETQSLYNVHTHHVLAHWSTTSWYLNAIFSLLHIPLILQKCMEQRRTVFGITKSPMHSSKEEEPHTSNISTSAQPWQGSHKYTKQYAGLTSSATHMEPTIFHFSLILKRHSLSFFSQVKESFLIF